MAEEKNEESKLVQEYIHDFFSERKWFLLLSGFDLKRTPLYITYMVLMMIADVYLQCLAIYGCYLAAPDIELILEALHVFLILLFGFWGVLIRVVCDGSLKRAREMVLRGIYVYEDEDIDDEQEKIMKSIREEAKRRSNILFFMFFTGACSNLIFFPTSQILMYTENDSDHSEDDHNPYLPLYFYIPFSTRSFLGVTAAYLLQVIIFVVIYGIALTMNFIFISFTVQMKAHLEALNYSISTITKRAYKVYIRNNNIQSGSYSQEELFGNVDYKRCLNSCLKANVKHHQALLRFSKEFETFNGACLLELYILAASIFASMLYLIYQGPPINFILNYLITFIAEQTYTYYICIYGEEIIAQSSELFASLYNISWMNCDKSFNNILRLMMCKTMRPVRIKATLLDLAASIQTYGYFYSLVYKIASILRQADKR